MLLYEILVVLQENVAHKIFLKSVTVVKTKKVLLLGRNEWW